MKLTIANRVGWVLFFTLLCIGLNAQTVAKFSANNVSGCSPLVVKFTDLSTGSPTKWKWDLGNGTTSFLQNPSAIYFNEGTYTIRLIVSNGTKSDTLTKTRFITVFSQPKVDFIGSVTSGCYPLPVQFKDKSSDVNGTITDWHWDFGDGFSSNLQNPQHTYTNSGSFNVILRVRNSNNCATTINKSGYIVIGAGVKASFSNNNPSSCSIPVTINFTNSSSGTGVLSSQWQFGDGSVSALTNPTHTYTTTGNFAVKLIVTNSKGCTDTIIKKNAVLAGTAKASFVVPDTICNNQAFLINNTSLPLPVSCSWSFGDGTFSNLTNPVKKYTVLGSYNIKLVADFGGCLNTVTTNITVKPVPTADFNAPVTGSCTAPFTVKFINNSKNAVGWFWDFGDSTTSTLQTPAHTYTATGGYTVQLIVKNAMGCTDTIRKQNFIKIHQPILTINNLPDSGCVPFTKKFSFNAQTVDSISNYLWNFGDSSTSTLASPTHTYSSTATANVSLSIITVGGCKAMATITRAIIATIKPVANFTATPRNTCAKTTVNFNDLSTGTLTAWAWQFGDNSNSFTQNPTHNYNDTGNFTIQLIASNAGCSDTVKFNNYIYINPPIARFKVNIDCKNNFNRTFTDQSIGADQWKWDFGDGSSSTLQNPFHTYLTTGTFQVSLQVINTLSGCDFITIVPIDIINVINTFTPSSNAICKGSNITFNTAFNLTDVVALSWDFGDGSNFNSNTNNTYHTYTVAGNYFATLVITTRLGCMDTTLKPIRVNGPTASFITASGGCTNSVVHFTNQSTSDSIHAIAFYNWNYGDGITDKQDSTTFTHFYVLSGKYPISLKVTDNIGCQDIFNLALPLIISKPVSNFNSPDTLSCPNQNINFTNLSTGPGLTYKWTFGDTTGATIQNPVHVYTADGNYNIKLIITDQYGCKDSLTKPGYIKLASPVACFGLSDSVSNCPPLFEQFTNTSTNAITFNWDFGDGSYSNTANPSHFYTYPGIYTAVLTVTSPGGCSNTFNKLINIKGPKGIFSYSQLIGCSPLNTNFTSITTGVVSMIWDFNDGNILDTKDSVVNHVYTSAGSFLPKIILVNKDGCHVPIKGMDTILVNGITPEFNFSTRALCDTESIHFFNTSVSNDLITGYVWNFDDGSFGTDQDAVHSYLVNGNYYPQLKVSTKYGCEDSVKTLIAVRVIASPQIKIDASPNGCTPLNVLLTGNLKIADTSTLTWKWSFINAQVSELQNPLVQTYTMAGLYPVSVIATNSFGCKDSANILIEAFPIPVVNAGRDSFICQGRGIILQATGAQTYSWFPADGLSCTDCAAPISEPAMDINYVVKGTNLQGCSASDSIKILVKFPFKITVSVTDTICTGQSRKILVSGGVSYSWTPAESLSNSLTASPTAYPDSSTNYMAIVKDEKKCFSDTGYVFIKVYPIPTVVAGANKTINIGQSYTIIPQISADVTSVEWSPVTAIIANKYPGILIKPSTNTDYTVMVKNPGGCRAEDKISIFVICDGSNVFIPNTFSPNGDGVNDIFYPRGTGIFKIKNLQIYNRWGELVFENNSFNANDASAGWNGTFKGLKLNPNVFDYTIEIICNNNSILKYKGNIALIQ